MRHPTLALLALAACTTDPPTDDSGDPATGGQFGQEDGSWCVEVSAVPLAPDEMGVSGITPQEILNLVVGEHAATLTWADGSSTGLSVPVAFLGEAWEITYESRAEDGDIDLGCPITVGVAATVGFVTEDGSFDESWELRLEGEDNESVSYHAELEELDGSFALADHVDVSGYEEIWTFLDMEFKVAGLRGTIEGLGQSSDPGTGGGDGSVSATVLPVATFEPSTP